MDVHARRIEPDDAVGRCLLREDLAEFLDQRCIPCGADHDLAREGNAAQAAYQRVDARRAVEIGGCGFADARDGGRRPAAVQNHRRHVLIGQLLKQKLPFRIVPIEPCHVLEYKPVVGINDIGIGCVHFIGILLGKRLDHRVGGGLAVHALFRRCARPIGTGNIDRDLSVLHIGEMTDRRGLIGRTRVALAVDDRFSDRIGTAVDHVMRVVHQFDFIIARIQYIAACAERVERRHILRRECDRHGFGFVRLQKAGLGKTDQHDMCLFDAALRIRRGIIDLYDVLARDAAGVGDLHLHGNRAAAADKGFDALCKRRIGKPVAERILHGLRIIDEGVRSRGFIVAVADIDALGVLDIVAVEVAVGKAARIPIGRGGREIVGIGIDQASRGVDFAGKHCAYRIAADRAGAADPKHRVDAILDKAELHRVRGIDQNDRLCKALRLDKSDQVFFILRQLEIVPPVVRFGIARRIHVLRQVAALAADARQNDDCNVGKSLRLRKHRIAVSGGRHFGRREIRAGIAALFGTGNAGILIEIHQIGIDREAGILKALDDIHIRGGVAGAAARAAVDRID